MIDRARIGTRQPANVVHPRHGDIQDEILHQSRRANGTKQTKVIATKIAGCNVADSVTQSFEGAGESGACIADRRKTARAVPATGRRGGRKVRSQSIVPGQIAAIGHALQRVVASA